MTDNRKNSQLNEAVAPQTDVVAPQHSEVVAPQQLTVSQPPSLRRSIGSGVALPKVHYFCTPELWAEQQRANRLRSRSSSVAASFNSVPTTSVELKRLDVQTVSSFTEDAVERSPGTPDVDFNDVSEEEIQSMVVKAYILENGRGRWRGVPHVGADDVYPSDTATDDTFEDHQLKYQSDEASRYRESREEMRKLYAEMERERKLREERYKREAAEAAAKSGNPDATNVVDYAVLVSVLWGMFRFNAFVGIARYILMLIELCWDLFKIARQHGWTETKRFVRERPKKLFLADLSFLLVFGFVFVSAFTAVSTVIGVFTLFVVSYLNGDDVAFNGAWYGIRLWTAYIWALTSIPFHQLELARRAKKIPEYYQPIGIWGDVTICLVKSESHDKLVVAVPPRPVEKLWQGKLIGTTRCRVSDTPISSLRLCKQEGLHYSVIFGRFVFIDHYDPSAGEFWHISRSCPVNEFVNKETDWPPASLEGRLIDNEPAFEVEEKAEEPVYQSSDGQFSELMRQLETATGMQAGKVGIITDVIAFVHVVMHTRSKAVLMTQAMALVTRYPNLGDYVMGEVDVILKQFERCPQDYFEQAFAPVLEYQSFSHGFKDTDVGVAFMDLLSLFTSGGLAAALGIVDVEWIKALQRFALHASAFTALDDLMKKLVKFIQASLKVLQECYVAGSFAPLWQGVTMNPTRYVELSSQLMNEVLIRDSSNTQGYLRARDKLDPDLRHGQISEAARLEMMQELYDLGSRYDSLKRGENDQFIYQSIQNVRNALRKEIDALKTKDELNRFREEPYSIGLCGPPGVGKSFLVRSLQRIVAADVGSSNSASIGFQWRVGQKYADGLTSAKRCYVFDDVDQKVGAPSFADSSPYIDWIMVRNNKPSMANMADVVEKGKVAYNAKMAIWASNKLPTFVEVRHHVKDVGAFARRFNSMWWVSLRPGVTISDIEHGRTDDGSWVFTEYSWVRSARQDADTLFAPSGLTIRSRLAFLKLITRQYKEKMSSEVGKAVALNAPDLPECGVCGVSLSDHFGGGCAAPVEAPPLVPVYQGPLASFHNSSTATEVLSNPFSMAQQASSKIGEMTEEDATKVVGYWIALLYGLHVLTLFYSMWFVTLLLETMVLAGAVGFGRLGEEDKVKVALFLFPKTTLMWLIGKGIMKFEMPALNKVVTDMRTSQAMAMMRVVLPALAIVSAILWLWNQKRTDYQSVLVEGDPEVIRTQPKKEQWQLMENTPRQLSTSQARTYNEVGFKKAVASQVARCTFAGRVFPLVYVNSKTWVTNAHHLLTGAPPRFSEVSVDMTFDAELRLKVEIGSYSNEFVVDSSSCVTQVPGRDTVFIRLDDMIVPGDGLLKFFPGDIDVNSEFASGSIMDCKDSFNPLWRKLVGLAKYKKMRQTHKVMLAYDVEGGNSYGLCGSLVCAPVTSGGWLILGHHSAGTSGASFAEPLTRSSVETYASRLYPQDSVRKASDVVDYQSSLLRSPSLAGPGSDVEVVATYYRTHVNSAVRSGAKLMALGTLRGHHARTFKSDVLPTPFKLDVEAQALDWHIPTEYLSPKALLTIKNGDDIVSPYTQILVKRKNIRGPSDGLRWARADYCEPILTMLRENKPYRLFSYAEVFSGDDDLTPTNLRTSTGPPYNTVKANYLRKLGEASWEVEPNLMADVNLLEACLSSGRIPGVVINAGVKAEAISKTKADQCRQRVLEIGPASHSAALKRRLGWLVGVIKANKGLFEMSIGMNVYGLDAERLFERLESAPCFDGDLTMQDGSTSTQYMDEISSIILDLCEAAGMPQETVEETRLLLLGFGDRLMCVLGDVFVITGGNPTGWYGTALYASLVTILLLRSSFFLAHTERFGRPPVFTFRSEVSSEVQGDDNVNSVLKSSTRDWFSGDSVARFAPLYGHKYTSADKGAEIVGWSNVRDISYLKRSFKNVEGKEVMALELKSIAKQLMFYRVPDGGSLESQWAVNITNASRELSLHGEEIFNKWRDLLNRCVEKAGCKDSRFLSLLPWRQTFEGVVKGELSLDTAVEEVTSDNLYYQSADGMPGVNLDVMTSASTETVHVPSGPVQVVKAAEQSAGNAAQHRVVRVSTQTLTTSDVGGNTLTAFELVNAMITNTQLTDVFQRYYAMSWESITLRLQHNSSGQMYGRYVVAVVPEAAIDDGTVSSSVMFLNSTHPNYHFVFNPANNEDIEFTIPWFGAADMLDLTTTDYRGPRWRVSLICLCPLTDALDSTGSAVSTVSFLANFNKIRFGAPVYQGQKRTIKPSSIVSTAATIGGAIMSVVPGAQMYLPLAFGLAAAGKALAEAGHTRHRAPEVASANTLTAVTGTGPVDGLDKGTVCDWIQAAQVSTDELNSGGPGFGDEMDFKFLARKRHLVNFLSLDASKGSGYVLASMPVTPYVTMTSGSNRCYHPLAHATLMAGYWRATMQYDVYFSCNALQSGSIFAYWTPTQQTVGSTISSDFISGASGCIIEVDPVKRWRVRVPWSVPSVASRVMGGLSTASRQSIEANGYITFLVMNPLSAPYSAVAQAVIEMSIGDDFNIGGVRTVTTYTNDAANYTEGVLIVQGTITQSGEEVEDCTLTSEVNSMDVDGVVLSSTLKSVKALCQRYSAYPGSGTSAYHGIAASGSVAGQCYSTHLSVPFYPTPPSSSTSGSLYHLYPTSLTRSAGGTNIGYSTVNGFTTIGWVSSMYTGCRGGMSHKLVFVPKGGSTFVNTVSCVQLFDREGYRLGDVEDKLTLFPHFQWPRALHGAAMYPTVMGTQSADFVMPYNSTRRFYPTCSKVSTAATNAKYVVLRIQSEGDWNLQWFQAAAADYTLVGFRFSPLIASGTY